MSSEREVKLGAWAGFAVPDVSDAVVDGRAVPLAGQDLEATYYDTSDLRLARSGISVRHRTGEGRTGEGLWTVKLPEGTDGPALVRREISVAAPARVIPDEVARLVRATVRSALLAPVATVQTKRKRIELRDAEDQRLVEIDDDEVSVVHGRRVAERFREIEVEWVGAADDRRAGSLLRRVADRLVEEGASPGDGRTKVVRALGPRALDPPDIEVVSLDGEPTTADVIKAALANGLRRLVRHDPGVRIGDDPEDVHQARVAARRLRSDLRTFRPVLVRDAAAALSDELRWIGNVLGGVRDADVLLDRLREQTSRLPGRDAKAAATLIRRLAADRDEARIVMLEALDSTRYVDALDALHGALAHPPVSDEAAALATDALPSLVLRPWRHLAKAVAGLPDEPPVEALHEIRIRAKRVRYAAEAAVPVIGKPAARLAAAVAKLQSVLGDLQDATVAEEWLRSAAVRAPAAQALVAGELIVLQQGVVDEVCRTWRPVWKAASAKKLTSWLS